MAEPGSRASRIYQQTIEVQTDGRGTYDLTGYLAEAVRSAAREVGLCNVFCGHASASQILCENADRAVRRDLERYFARLVPDDAPLYEHTTEGPDDTPAHLRSIITHNSVNAPIAGGCCALGLWQGLSLWEHRAAAYRPRVLFTVTGDSG